MTKVSFLNKFMNALLNKFFKNFPFVKADFHYTASCIQVIVDKTATWFKI